MTLKEILDHPGDQEMVFEGEAMADLLASMADAKVWPGGLTSLQILDIAKRVRLSPSGKPADHGIEFCYAVGRHWTYEPKDCKHDQFRISADITPVGESPDKPEVLYRSASIQVNCLHCGDPFEFVGLPFGFSPYRPTVSIDGQTLSVSVMPVGKKIPEGLAGFNVTAQVFDEKEATKQ